MTTRRTHIVRISPDDPPSETYVDVEVLDAIAFRTDTGKEMVLSFEASAADPYIVDDTGGKNGKTPAQPTRRSHMKRIVGKTDATHKLDVEVIDAIGFRDERGEEWILDMQATNGDDGVFNSTTGAGGSGATRRVHDEKIGFPFGEKKPTDYIKIERCDAMAFRSIRGKEMIIVCPSNDDPNSSFPRADTTVTSPKDYDPTNEDGPKPPANKDPNVYVAFVKGANGDVADPTTGDVSVSQGPLWWIRKVSSGKGIIYGVVHFRVGQESGTAPLPTVTIQTNAAPGKTYDLLGNITQARKGVEKVPAVTDPVTGAMLNGLLQWTPTSMWTEQKSSSETIKVWIIDTATWSGTLRTLMGGNQFTGQVAGGSQEAARREMAQALYDAYGNINGFLIPPDFPYSGAEYVNNVGQPLPGPPDPSFYANGGTAHEESQTKAGTTTEGRAVFALNIGLIAGALPPDATELTFTIDVATPTGIVDISASGYKTLKKFPLDAKNVPTFSAPEKAGSGANGRIVGHLNLKDNKDLKITYTGSLVTGGLG